MCVRACAGGKLTKASRIQKMQSMEAGCDEIEEKDDGKSMHIKEIYNLGNHMFDLRSIKKSENINK